MVSRRTQLSARALKFLMPLREAVFSSASPAGTSSCMRTPAVVVTVCALPPEPEGTSWALEPKEALERAIKVAEDQMKMGFFPNAEELASAIIENTLQSYVNSGRLKERVLFVVRSELAERGGMDLKIVFDGTEPL